MSFARTVWGTLSAINVNPHVEKKGPMKLSYLSWAWAWSTLMEEFPESSFSFDEPHHFPDGSVEVRVTVAVAQGDASVYRVCWLPVMDNKNNAIKNPDARQVSDAKMRCLVKCLALHGLGMYLYAGEDLPGNEAPEPEPSLTESQVADWISAMDSADASDMPGIAKNISESAASVSQRGKLRAAYSARIHALKGGK